MDSKIPAWMIQCLDQYGNCACGRAIVKKMSKEGLLETLEQMGYPCTLDILTDSKDKNSLPKDATYILNVKAPKATSEAA